MGDASWSLLTTLEEPLPWCLWNPTRVGVLVLHMLHQHGPARCAWYSPKGLGLCVVQGEDVSFVYKIRMDGYLSLSNGSFIGWSVVGLAWDLCFLVSLYAHSTNRVEMSTPRLCECVGYI